MSGKDPPEIMATSMDITSGIDLLGDISQTPKQLSSSDMTLLLSDNSLSSQDLQSLNNIGENLNNAAATVLSAVSASGQLDPISNHNSISDIAPSVTVEQVNSNQPVASAPQTLYVSGAPGQQVISHAASLLNSSTKRVILQPSNAAINSVVHNLVPGQSLVQGIKRPAPSGPQVVTKFIIQKGPTGGQHPVLVTQKPSVVTQPVMSVHQNVMSSLSSMVTSPSKTITLTQGGVLSPAKTVTIPGTPPRQLFSTGNKIAISPAKTPTKITMIPVSNMSGKSPQKIIPVTIPKSAILSGGQTIQLSTQSLAALTGGDGKTLTLSPSKIVVKHPHPISVSVSDVL